MILGFLRSASGLLVKGPQTLGSRKAKAREGGDNTDVDSDQESELSSQTHSSGGTVIITLRNVPPYTECKDVFSHGRLRADGHTPGDICRLAKKPPPPAATGMKHPNPAYTILRSFVFHRWAWKGYEHRLTKGEKGKTGEGGEDRSWEFYLKDGQ